MSFRKQSRKPYEQPPPSPIEISFWNAAKPLIPELQREVWVDKKYRVDFLIPSKKVVIELYGYQHHNTKEKITKDAERERYLQKIGYQVIRFTGTEVFKDVQKCVNEVLALANLQPATSLVKSFSVGEPFIDKKEWYRSGEATIASASYSNEIKVSNLSVDGLHTQSIARPARLEKANYPSQKFFGMKTWQIGILTFMFVSFISIWLCLILIVLSS